MKQKKKTPTPEESRHSNLSSPILPRPRGGTPSSSKVQSTTPFIPGQRKSALKRTASSQSMRSSSPAGSKASTDDSSGVGIEMQMPFPKSHARRVSFRDEPEKNVTPVRAERRILPPKFGTPQSTPATSTPKPLPNVATPSSSTPKPSGLATKAAIAHDSGPRSSQGTSKSQLNVCLQFLINIKFCHLQDRIRLFFHLVVPLDDQALAEVSRQFSRGSVQLRKSHKSSRELQNSQLLSSRGRSPRFQRLQVARASLPFQRPKVCQTTPVFLN